MPRPGGSDSLQAQQMYASISFLNSVSQVALSDSIPVVQGNTSKRATFSQVFDSIKWVSNLYLSSGVHLRFGNDVGFKRGAPAFMYLTDGSDGVGSLVVEEILFGEDFETQPVGIGVDGIKLGSSKTISWYDSDDIDSGTADIVLARAGAGDLVVKQDDSTLADVRFAELKTGSSPTSMDAGIGRSASGILKTTDAGSNLGRLLSKDFHLKSDGVISWCTASDPATVDVTLAREDAHKLQLKDGSQCTLNIYGNTTDYISITDVAGTGDTKGGKISVAGSDTNRDLWATPKGTGKLQIGGGGAALPLGSVSAPSLTFGSTYGSTTGMYYNSTDSRFTFAISAADKVHVRNSRVIVGRGTDSAPSIAFADDSSSMPNDSTFGLMRKVSGDFSGALIVVNNGEKLRMLPDTGKFSIYSGTGNDVELIAYANDDAAGCDVKLVTVNVDATPGPAGDIWFEPGYTGYVKFGVYTAGAPTPGGYIEIKSSSDEVLRIPVYKVP